MMSRLLLTASALAFMTNLALADMPQSAGILEFGPDNTLFVADSTSGMIHAYELPSDGAAPEKDAAFNLLDIDAVVGEALGSQGRLLYGDLAVHPVTREAYVTVTATIDGAEKSSVVSISREGSVQKLDLAALSSSSFELNDKAEDGVTFWRDIPASTLTVTDLDFANGELFVSGVATGEFASTLRRVPYPFKTESTSSSIEIYHAAHNQNETRAPIRASAFTNAGFAGYWAIIWIATAAAFRSHWAWSSKMVSMFAIACSTQA